jgi:hypothetical protein
MPGPTRRPRLAGSASCCRMGNRRFPTPSSCQTARFRPPLSRGAHTAIPNSSRPVENHRPPRPAPGATANSLELHSRGAGRQPQPALPPLGRPSRLPTTPASDRGRLPSPPNMRCGGDRPPAPNQEPTTPDPVRQSTPIPDVSTRLTCESHTQTDAVRRMLGAWPAEGHGVGLGTGEPVAQGYCGGIQGWLDLPPGEGCRPADRV